MHIDLNVVFAMVKIQINSNVVIAMIIKIDSIQILSFSENADSG